MRRRTGIVLLAAIALALAVVGVSQALPDLLREEVSKTAPAVVIEDPARADVRGAREESRRSAPARRPRATPTPQPVSPPAPVPAPLPPPPAAIEDDYGGDDDDGSSDDGASGDD